MIVTGLIDGAVYEVNVDGGRVEGNARVQVLLEDQVGERVLISPTGPAVTVDLQDLASVMAVLQTATTVTGTEGAPKSLGPRMLRAVY